MLQVLASASYDDTVKLYRDDGDNWITTATLSMSSSTFPHENPLGAIKQYLIHTNKQNDLVSTLNARI